MLLRDRDRLYKRSVGLLVIFSVLTVLVMLRLHQQTAGPFRETLALHAALPRADGVAVDTPVTLAGLKVGRVSGVNLGADGRVRVDLVVEARVADRIRADSRATLVRPLIGAAFIDIGIGSAASPPLGHGQQIAAQRAPDLNDLVATLPDRLAAIDRVLADAQAVTADLRRLSGELTARDGPLTRSAAQIAGITAEGQDAVRRLNLALDEVRRVVSEAGNTVATTRAAVEEVRLLAGELRPLAPQAAAMADSLARSLHNVEAITAELRGLAPQLPPAVAAGQQAIEEADAVMRAAKNSFLLRGSLPPPADPPGIPAPRP
jgi:ABC-type transporter Mla subunit MlaD